jgi:hypothetical protein
LLTTRSRRPALERDQLATATQFATVGVGEIVRKAELQTRSPPGANRVARESVKSKRFLKENRGFRKVFWRILRHALPMIVIGGPGGPPDTSQSNPIVISAAQNDGLRDIC